MPFDEGKGDVPGCVWRDLCGLCGRLSGLVVRDHLPYADLITTRPATRIAPIAMIEVDNINRAIRAMWDGDEAALQRICRRLAESLKIEDAQSSQTPAKPLDLP